MNALDTPASRASARMQTALQLEQQGELESALAMLKEIRQITRLSERPAQMELAIRRIEGKIQQASADSLFAD